MIKVYRTHRGIIGAQRVRKRRTLKAAAYFLGLFFVFAIFHVWTSVRVVEAGYQIRQLIEQGEELKGQNHSLRVEVASLRSPVRLEKIASNLGLKRPPEKQVTLMTYRTQ